MIKIRKFPLLRQRFKYDCGANAIRSVLIYYGIDEDEKMIMKIAGTNRLTGTPVKGIKKVADNFGLTYKDGILNIDKLKKNIKKGHPTIIAVQAWSKKKNVDYVNDWKDGHYVIAIGYDKEKIYFEDPSSINRTYLNYKELEERWHDKIKGKKVHDYGIYFYGNKPKHKNGKAEHMK